jgi:predicted transcriptional regulator
LLSIRPHYAEAIFRGEKKYEYRRAIFKQPVDVVVVYITSPTSQIVGEFEVAGIIADSIESLWRRTNRAAGIAEDAFFKYFDGKEVGYAIKIGTVRRYRNPKQLGETYGIRAPQSFVYI